MTYEQWDTIADLYVPLLWIACILRLVYELRVERRYIRLITYLAMPIIVYGFMLLDQALEIWPAADLDYSTHAAAALAGVYIMYSVRPARILWPASFVAYCALMLYQEYHSILDILSTSIAVGITITGFHFALKAITSAN